MPSGQEARIAARPNTEIAVGGDARAVLSLSALLSGVAILVLGNGLQGTLLGVRAGIEGMAAETIGLIMSAYFVGFAVACFVVPPLVERVGHIRTFAALASIASAIALAHAIFVTAAVWILLRIAQGACYAGLIMVIESWLNASTGRRHRGRVLATYSVVLYAAWALSQPMLSVAPPSDFVLFCVVSICLSLALVPITLMGSGGPGFVTASRTGLRRLYQISPVGLVGALAVGAVTGAVLGMGPTFAQNNGLSDFGISAFMGLTIGGALALQWPLGMLSDHVGRRPVMLASCLAAGAASLGLTFAAQESLPLLFALSFLFGGFSVPMYSLAVAHVNDHIEADELIAAASSLVLLYGAGAAIGPFGASLAMGRVGPPGLFGFAAVILFAFAGFTVFRMVKRRPLARELRDRFVGVPSTTHAHLPLHRHSTGRAPGEAAPR